MVPRKAGAPGFDQPILDIWRPHTFDPPGFWKSGEVLNGRVTAPYQTWLIWWKTGCEKRVTPPPFFHGCWKVLIYGGNK